MQLISEVNKLFHSDLSCQLCSAELVETSIRLGEGLLTHRGALSVRTGKHTGRSPKDRYIVDDPSIHGEIDWGGINQPVERDEFEKLLKQSLATLNQFKTFKMEGSACADPEHSLNVRVISDHAWQILFAKCLFRKPLPKPASRTITILVDTKASETRILMDLVHGIVLIRGTAYAGEIKKSVFSFLNFQFPRENVFPMHCAATMGRDGDVALLFGLSGTGKTTLSADPDRLLIGDDEHGWSSHGVFNFEGGCYAKTIRLSPKAEPNIYNAIRFGAVLENVPLAESTRIPDFFDDSITENTRVAYSLDMLEGICPDSMGGHPANIFFLTCDAFGVLPPLSRLDENQAMYHFLSGYTAKVAGTEQGVKEPSATFSACFGAPFMPRSPGIYADMLREKIRKHHSKVWLVNTGWRGGGPGVGTRFPLPATRALLAGALHGDFDHVKFRKDEVFGLDMPENCPGVENALLDPKSAWQNLVAYNQQRNRLCDLFVQNFKKFQDKVRLEVSQAGPKALR
ncbi:MAG: phosphoenolpyruvate carboxykinase (ATP) [Gemmataceae bacterium]